MENKIRNLTQAEKSWEAVNALVKEGVNPYAYCLGYNNAIKDCKEEVCDMDFIVWYSGMSKERIQAARERYKREVTHHSSGVLGRATIKRYIPVGDLYNKEHFEPNVRTDNNGQYHLLRNSMKKIKELIKNREEIVAVVAAVWISVVLVTCFIFGIR